MHQATRPSSLTTTPQSTVVLLEPSDRQQLDIERGELLQIPLPTEIASPREFEELSQQLELVDRFVKRAKPSFDDVCNNAHKAWKSATELRAMFFERLEGFSQSARRLLGAYKAKQDEIRRHEQRRLEEEERQRQLARQREEAKLLEKQGQKELAAAVRATPVTAQPVTLPDPVPKVQGMTFRDEWKWRFVGNDRATAERLLPREYMSANETKLNAVARSMKGAVKVPGVQFYCEKVPVRR